MMVVVVMIEGSIIPLVGVRCRVTVVIVPIIVVVVWVVVLRGLFLRRARGVGSFQHCRRVGDRREEIGIGCSVQHLRCSGRRSGGRLRRTGACRQKRHQRRKCRRCETRPKLEHRGTLRPRHCAAPPRRAFVVAKRSPALSPPMVVVMMMMMMMMVMMIEGRIISLVGVRR